MVNNTNHREKDKKVMKCLVYEIYGYQSPGMQILNSQWNWQNP